MAARGRQGAQSTGLLSLPDEILLEIAEFVPSQRDLSRFLRVCRRLHVVFRELILQRNIKYSNSSAMMWAVSRNHVEVVCRLVRLGANPAEEDQTGWGLNETPLLRAVKDRNLRLVKILTGEEAQKTAKILGTQNWTEEPLRWALNRKDERIARILISRLETLGRINSYICDVPRKTALDLACELRLVDTAQYLLSKGADPNWQQRTGWADDVLAIKDPLQQRLDEDAIHILRLLFDYGLIPNDDFLEQGSEHRDPRVRWLCRRYGPALKSLPGAEDDGAAKTGSDGNHADSFPSLGSVSPAVDDEAQRRWAEFRTTKHDSLAPSQLRALEAAKHNTQHAVTEEFPSLGSPIPYAKHPSSDGWANFRSRNASTARNDLTRNIAAASPPELIPVSKRGGHQKTKWRKIQL